MVEAFSTLKVHSVFFTNKEHFTACQYTRSTVITGNTPFKNIWPQSLKLKMLNRSLSLILPNETCLSTKTSQDVFHALSIIWHFITVLHPNSQSHKSGWCLKKPSVKPLLSRSMTCDRLGKISRPVGSKCPLECIITALFKSSLFTLFREWCIFHFYSLIFQIGSQKHNKTVFLTSYRNKC